MNPNALELLNLLIPAVTQILGSVQTLQAAAAAGVDITPEQLAAHRQAAIDSIKKLSDG